MCERMSGEALVSCSSNIYFWTPTFLCSGGAEGVRRTRVIYSSELGPAGAGAALEFGAFKNCKSAHKLPPGGTLWLQLKPKKKPTIAFLPSFLLSCLLACHSTSAASQTISFSQSAALQATCTSAIRSFSSSTSLSALATPRRIGNEQSSAVCGVV